MGVNLSVLIFDNRFINILFDEMKHNRTGKESENPPNKYKMGGILLKATVCLHLLQILSLQVLFSVLLKYLTLDYCEYKIKPEELGI